MLICNLNFSDRLISRGIKFNSKFLRNEKAIKKLSIKNFNKTFAHKSIYFRKSERPFKTKYTGVSVISKFLNFDPFYYCPSRPIFLFRSDLSYEENNFLKFALSLPVIPVFIYCSDPEESKRSSSKRKFFWIVH